MIYELLPQGEQNAVPTRDLVKITGFRSARDLQLQVAHEREEGKLILSTCKGGYFLPSDGEQGMAEIAAFVATLHSRAINTLRALRAAKAALCDIEGQIPIEGSVNPDGER